MQDEEGSPSEVEVITFGIGKGIEEHIEQHRRIIQSEMMIVDRNNEQPSLGIRMNIVKQGGLILIQFDKPIQFIRITKRQAREMARRLVKESL